jgi:hypothetical protein
MPYTLQVSAPSEDVSYVFFDVAVGGALQLLGGQSGEPPFDTMLIHDL